MAIPKTVAMAVCGLLQVTLARAAPPERQPAQSAAVFLDSIGMNTHFTATGTGAEGTSYANPEALLRELRFVHIRHLRDSLFIGAKLPDLEMAYGQLGARFDLVYDDYRHDGGQDNLNRAIANLQGQSALIEAIEGPNEPDQFGLFYDGLTGAPAVMAAQTDIYAAVKKNLQLAALPVLCTALSYPASGGMANRLGNLMPACDVSTAHVYIENLTLGPSLPFDYIAKWSAFPLSFARAHRRMITEGGWSTATGDVGGVDEATQAKYLLTYLLDAFSQGIERTYLYELSDDGFDATNANSEFHYGVFHYDGTPKPAAAMLARLHAFLGTGTATPGSLAYTVTGLPDNSHQLLLQRADGAFVLALWHESYLWNRTSRKPRDQASVTASLTLDQPARSIARYDPLSDGGPQPLDPAQPTIAIDVPDHPILVLIGPKTPGTITPLQAGHRRNRPAR